MQSIFNSTTQTPNIAEVGFLDHYSDIDANTTWAEIKPKVEDATIQYIIPYIGEPFCNQLTQKLTDDITITPSEDEALRRLRRTAAYYAASLWLPLKHTLTASGGIMQNNTNQATSASLSSTKFSLWKITLQADNHLDSLLAFMEQQVAEENPDFDTWKNDPAYHRGSTPFFKRTSDFQEYFNIFNSRPTFLALTNHINDICEDTITPIICDDLFIEIATQITNGDLTPENKTLLHLIRRIIAPLSIAHAAPYLSLVVEADGFKIVSSKEGMDMREASRNYHQAQVQTLVNRCQAQAKYATDKLKKYLTDNIDKYPLYQNSRCYAAAHARTANFGINVLTDNGKSAYIYKR